MTPAAPRWGRLEEVFDRAIERPAEERAAFVARTCADDEELRAEVLGLLASAGGARAALSRTVAAAAESLARAGACSLLGTRLGPYRLLDVLGEGGMGTVYLAERADDEYRGKVAIKLLRHALASPQVIARFRDERQILATLEHPAIVRLLDGAARARACPPWS